MGASLNCLLCIHRRHNNHLDSLFNVNQTFILSCTYQSNRRIRFPLVRKYGDRKNHEPFLRHHELAYRSITWFLLVRPQM